MKSRPYTVADAMIDVLKAHNVSTLFGYPGGAILPFYDALPFHPEVKHVLVRNEQGAAFMAQGWARSKRELGVCCATSGPGGTNLITGIADAYLDSIPLLCITGQVPLSMIGKDMFQEVDMTGITLNITKHNYLVDAPEKIVPIMAEAIHIATSGRPGPVHVDVPKDIQASEHPREFTIPQFEITETNPQKKSFIPPSDETIGQVLELIHNAKKPVFLFGQGIKFAKADAEANALINALGIPTVTTLLGKGMIHHDNPYYLGMLGMHGFYHANKAVHEADLIFNIGSRFDDRIVGRYDAFGENAKIVHVDIDTCELNKVVTVDLAIQSDAKVFLQKLLQQKITKKEIDPWLKQIKKWNTDAPYEKESQNYTIRSCYVEIMKEVEKDPEQYIIVTDVGQHQMWASLSCTVLTPEQWLTSGGSGTMGFALPAAIGAAFAHPEKTILCLAGDGGIQMNIQELSVLKDHNLNVKVCILNNSYLGMVRQWQELFYENNYSAVEITSPDYATVAKGYGLDGYTLSSIEQVQKSHPEIYNSNNPMVIEYQVEKADNVFPMVPGGKTLGETIVEHAS